MSYVLTQARQSCNDRPSVKTFSEHKPNLLASVEDLEICQRRLQSLQYSQHGKRLVVCHFFRFHLNSKPHTFVLKR